MNNCPTCGSKSVWKFVDQGLKKGKCEDCEHIFNLQDNKVVDTSTKK